MLATLALRYISKRPWQYLMTIIVVAISMSLSVAVLLVSASLRNGIIYASMPFDMMVGAKGSPVQLIFNTIFLQDVPIGNIDHSLMVMPVDYTGLMQMYQETNQNNEAQAAFPGQVLANVFSIMGNAEDVLYLISYMVIIVGFLTIIITLQWSVLNRKRDHATLRAIGANKSAVFSLILEAVPKLQFLEQQP